MAWSKETRIKFFIGVDILFFLIELVIGYWAHSLALIADAFHMLNDVISLFVGLWAVKVAARKQTDTFTYGWARAETLGGLVNGVFLVALCMTIFLEAIQRFFAPQQVQSPVMVFVVGGVGLVFNILGLFLFHQSHGHSHGDDEEHGHAHGEEGHAHAHTHGAGDAHAHDHANGGSAPRDIKTPAAADVGWTGGSSHSRRAGSRTFNHQDFPVHPEYIRGAIRAQARLGEGDDDSDSAASADEGGRTDSAPTERTPLVPGSGKGAHHGHHHTKPQAAGGGGRRRARAQPRRHEHARHVPARRGRRRGQRGRHGERAHRALPLALHAQPLRRPGHLAAHHRHHPQVGGAAHPRHGQAAAAGRAGGRRGGQDQGGHRGARGGAQRAPPARVGPHALEAHRDPGRRHGLHVRGGEVHAAGQGHQGVPARLRHPLEHDPARVLRLWGAVPAGVRARRGGGRAVLPAGRGERRRHHARPRLAVAGLRRRARLGQALALRRRPRPSDDGEARHANPSGRDT